MALGTSLGYHVIWDMRFQLPIRHWQHTGHGKCVFACFIWVLFNMHGDAYTTLYVVSWIQLGLTDVNHRCVFTIILVQTKL